MEATKSIPLELITQIISYLQNDAKALRHASLASSPFRIPCQKIIFSELRLQPPENSRKQYSPGSQLLPIFKQSPELCSFVKRILIVDNPADCWNGCSWLASDERLAETLSSTPFGALQHFQIRRGYRTKWDQLPTKMKTAIMALCQTPSLVSLTLAWVPLALVDGCGPKLKHLDLSEVEVHTDVEYPQAPTTTTVRLDTLRLDHEYNLAETVNSLVNYAPRIDIRSIKKLYMRASTIDDHTQIHRMTTLCTSLEVLEFEPNTTTPFDLSALADLRKLAIRFYAPQDPFSDVSVDCVPWILAILETLPNSNMLEKIHIQSFCDSDGVDGVEHWSWGRFDEALCDESRFAGLREVVIHAFESDGGEVDVDLDEVKGLKASGKLRATEAEGGYDGFEPFT